MRDDGLQRLEEELRERNPERRARLWAMADRVRRRSVGDGVHPRALVEWSSFCRRACLYCGLRAGHPSAVRYRLDDAVVLDCARQAEKLGCGSLVLQAGEDPQLSRERVAGLVRRIKRETALAVTLSLGERDRESLAAWREAGADRYLLRFETSDTALFRSIHPAHPAGRDRLEQLRDLKELGYQTGSGVMIGIPGQSCASLARDLLYFRERQLDMVGVGPYIADPRTPMADFPPGPDNVAADVETTLTVIALVRILLPQAHIPATTALSTLDPISGRERGLQAGANVWMPNFTPADCREGYAIYPGKERAPDRPEELLAELERRLAVIGRYPARGPGHALRLAGARPGSSSV